MNIDGPKWIIKSDFKICPDPRCAKYRPSSPRALLPRSGLSRRAVKNLLSITCGTKIGSLNPVKTADPRRIVKYSADIISPKQIIECDERSVESRSNAVENNQCFRANWCRAASRLFLILFSHYFCITRELKIRRIIALNYARPDKFFSHAIVFMAGK